MERDNSQSEMGEEKINNQNAESEDCKSEEDRAGEDAGGLVKIVKDMGVIGLSKILTAVSGIILLPVLTRYLGAYGYGLWTNMRATLNVATMLLLLGLPPAVSRMFPSKSEKERGEDLFSMIFLISLIVLVFSSILYLYPDFLANIIFDGETFVVRFTAIIIFVWSLDTLLLRSFQGFRELKKYAGGRVLTKYFEIGLAIFLVTRGHGLLGALTAVVVARTFLLFILIIIFSKRFGLHRPTFSRLKGIKKNYLNYGVPLILSSLTYWIISTSDRYLITYFLGVEDVGFYSPGYSIGRMVPFMLGQMILFVLVPSLSDFYDNGDTKKVRSVLGLAIKYSFIFSTPYLFGILLFHQEIVALFTTTEIATKGSFIAIYTALTGLSYILLRTFEIILNLVKKTKIIAITKTISASINIGGNIILIPFIGIVGAAITTLVSYSFIALTYIIITRKHLIPKIGLSSLLKIIISSISMYILISTSLGFIDIYFLYFVPLGILIYFGILFGIKGISRQEIQFIKGLMK